MKKKVNADDKLPLNKSTMFSIMIIFVRTNFYENNNYYPKFVSDECLHKI